MTDLEELASERRTSIGGIALEQLASLVGRPARDEAQLYEDFIRHSGLFAGAGDRRASGVPDSRMADLAAKLGAAGPLSEVIIADRGEQRGC